MAFTFAARTLLELGKELISSDDVALYELIKNGVDAQQPLKLDAMKVRVSARVWLLKSDYLRSLKQLDAGVKPKTVLAEIRDKALEGHGGLETILASLAKAIGSTGKFRVALQEAFVQNNWLEVGDDGSGMSKSELTSVFLRIGTRSRRKENLGGSSYLGDKGVGRLSAMRLGDRLRVRTSRRGEANYSILDIDWSLFSHDSDLRVDEIEVEPKVGDEKLDPKSSGTIVRVHDLNADWDEVRFKNMLQGRVARMVDPFVNGRANRLIDARFNGRVVLVPSIPIELLRSAHATLKAELTFEGKEPVITGNIDYTQKQRQRRIDVRGVEIYSLTQDSKKRRGKKGHAATALTSIDPVALEMLGPFECEIYWFNRRVVTGVQNLSSSMAETRQRIAEWAGGPMLYRHDFRVLPYGDPDDDWLALDEAAFGQSGFKLNRQQVIGRISVRSPHTALSEQTNREGLIESEPANALKRIMTWLLHVQMRGLIKEVDREEDFVRRSAMEDAANLREARTKVEATINEFRALAGNEHEWIIARLNREVADLSAQASSLVSRLDKVVDEADSEREKFVYLAGVGLMTEFIFHEMDRAVGHTLSVLSRANEDTRGAVLDGLVEQLKTLQKRISAFDEMTSERRQTKSVFDLRDAVSTIVESHRNEFDRHSVTVRLHLPEKPFRIKAVRGMLIQIVENLLTNALYWLKRQHAFETDFKPTVWIRVDAKTRSLVLEDNGPGVSADRIERIFQPFETTKPAGQGRGLGLYISRELAVHHKWSLSMDPTLGRRRPGRTNSFVLELG